tara:strand:- start:233 stop:1345 length:1113 start_codon:yes stop_codon:yes gene_type:complete
MGKLSSESDYVITALPDYTLGKGYYTSHSEVSDLLQVGAFSGSSVPSIAMVGKIIKRVEGRIDDSIKLSFRPEIIEKEVHNFESLNMAAYPVQSWNDYMGFIQLHSENIRKIVKLEVYQGSEYVELASASIKYTPPETATNGTYTITLGVGDATTGYRFVLTKGNANGFYDTFGQKTTVLQICDAINEVFPHKTAQFTGETAIKTTTDAPDGGGITRNISDFFYASASSDGKSVVITSLLPSDAGTICNVSSTHGSPTTSASFIDNESSGRNEDYWVIGDEGKIFFRQNYPYYENHSIRVTYVRGKTRVPASIHEAATKLVAAEILVHDDNTILIAETGSNIDLKTKHDILIQEAEKIIKGKQVMLHLID